MVQFLYQFGDSFATLVLAAIGLAIIFGMMGIINLAHGEFIMIGAMTTASFCAFGIPFALSVILGAVITGVLGLILDRVIICHLYKRPLDSVVATWGISMVIKQLASFWQQNMFGGNIPGIKTPFGSIKIAGISMSVYKLFLIVLSVLVVITIYLVFNHTVFGLKSRATMQKNDIAESLGVSTSKVYAKTFMLGSLLAGLAGGLFAPLFTVANDFGSNYMMPSFVTVLVGGANPIIGIVLAGISLSCIQSAVTTIWTTLFGQIGMLAASVVFIRFCPKGLSDLVARIQQKRELKRVLKEREENTKVKADA